MKTENIKKDVERSDGKRTVKVSSDGGTPEISICRNGYQTTVVAADLEMLEWLFEALDEYLHGGKHLMSVRMEVTG